MRLPRLLLCLCLSACAQQAERTPPLSAAAPAASPAREAPPPGGRLPEDTQPQHYQLALDVDPAQPGYRGEIAITLTLARPRDTLWLHARGLRVSKVQVAPRAGQPLAGTFAQVSESGLASIQLPQPLEGEVRVTLAFEGDFGKRLSGLYRVEAGGAPYAFTQFEAIAAREAFPCLDEPRFKAPLALTLRVPAGQQALANTQVASERTLDDGRREVVFQRTEKLPTYLYALAVGPLDVMPAPPLPASPLRERPVPLRGVAVRGRGPDLAFALRGTPALVSYLERYFGVPYAFDKLDLIAVPDFAAGAMENAGAITFRDTLLLQRDDAPETIKRRLTYTNAHELAHQWFGDLVTMPWWDDIWLNEAFATWMGGKAVGAVHPEYDADLGALTATHNAMEVDSKVASRKIRQPIESDHDIASAFDAITYNKGGAVLSMFEGYLGAERFQHGLQEYMKRHRFGSATAADLVRALADTAGEPALEPAFFTFLDQPGVPEVQVQVDCSGPAPTLKLSQARYQPLGVAEPLAGAWHIPMCVRYGTGSGARQACTLLREKEASLALEGSCPKWVLPNAKAAGYYRFRLDEQGLSALLAQRAQLTTRERMSLASNAVAGLRAGRTTPAAAMAVARALATSKERTVVETALQAYRAIDPLLDDPARARMRAEVAELLAPAYAKYGLFGREGERGDDKLWRELVARTLYAVEAPVALKALARAGRALIDDAGSAASASRATQSSKLSPEITELALAAAVREGDRALFDKVEQQLLASQDGLERTRRIAALSASRDPALAERALSLSLDDRLRTNERVIPVLAQLSERETRGRALAWLQGNVDALAQKVAAHAGGALVASTGSFCTARDAEAVEALFEAHAPRIPGGPRALALSLETIRSCVALEQAQGEAVRALYGAGRQARPQPAAARRERTPAAAFGG